MSVNAINSGGKHSEVSPKIEPETTRTKPVATLL
jgi:hypothetical protein